MTYKDAIEQVLRVVGGFGTRWVYLSRYRGKPVSAESLRRIGELIRERMQGR